ncbi:cilia- and flagella-associated protein 107 isoform X2 [Nelusetta ayraudi]|uniref:cilia- and flagella-associated protein 107 isoform X2 n=1 Tax=Nelusetta ayraudi TaxID=303726 RepID=UPI003F6FC1A2
MEPTRLENRAEFTRELETASGGNHMDRQAHRDLEPGVFERRCAPPRAEEVHTKRTQTTVYCPPSDGLIMHYKECCGSKHSSALPTLRHWHRDNLTWQPQNSHGPISAAAAAPAAGPPPPTKKCRRLSEERPSCLPPLSAYRSAYTWHAPSALCQGRYARASRELSSHLHAANNGNKDLRLRGRTLLQIPDASISPPSQQA